MCASAADLKAEEQQPAAAQVGCQQYSEDNSYMLTFVSRARSFTATSHLVTAGMCV